MHWYFPEPDDPVWYTDYMRGLGDRKLPAPAKKLLEYLDKGEWRNSIKRAGAGKKSIEACLEIGLVKKKNFQISEKNKVTRYRITREGEKALETGELP
jgi:hypothetical protein